VTIFGADWSDLGLAHLTAFLDQAEDEPLLWEAKGTELNKKELRRQVAAFANSHEGGYLILGADRPKGAAKWAVEGLRFPDEPRTWISEIIADPVGGVRPRPDFDVRAWPTTSGHVAVIWVRPTSTPPCTADGTVFERLPGKTQTVKDPQLLAGLFARGDAARREAQGRADRAALSVMRDWLESDHGQFRREGFFGESSQDLDPEQHDRDYIRFSVGAAATGYAPNVAARLFRNELAEEVWHRLGNVPVGHGLPRAFGASPDAVYWSQDALTWRLQQTFAVNAITIVRASWDGAAAAGQKIATEDAYPDRLAETRIREQWAWADELMLRLGGYGDVYVTVLLAGGRFPRVEAGTSVVMRRGPILPGVDLAHVASFGRELMRALGHPDEEPAPSEPSNDDDEARGTK
jgi:hypothetical protein